MLWKWDSRVVERSPRSQIETRAPFTLAFVAPAFTTFVRQTHCQVWRGHTWRAHYLLSRDGFARSSGAVFGIVEFCCRCGASRKRPATWPEARRLIRVRPDHYRVGHGVDPYFAVVPAKRRGPVPLPALPAGREGRAR